MTRHRWDDASLARSHVRRGCTGYTPFVGRKGMVRPFVGPWDPLVSLERVACLDRVRGEGYGGCVGLGRGREEVEGRIGLLGLVGFGVVYCDSSRF